MRIWRTDFDVSRQAELQEFADTVSTPMFDALDGCTGHIYGVDGSTWITTTFWESEAAIEAAENSSEYRAVVEQIMGAGFLGSNQTVEVSQVTKYDPPSART